MNVECLRIIITLALQTILVDAFTTTDSCTSRPLFLLISRQKRKPHLETTTLNYANAISPRSLSSNEQDDKIQRHRHHHHHHHHHEDRHQPDSYELQEPKTKRKQNEQVIKGNKKSKSKSKPKVSKQELLWNMRYQELFDFHKINGHSNVPYNHPNHQLSRWVTNQRQNKRLKRKSMTTQRIAKLNELNFEFQMEKNKNGYRSYRNESTWMAKYNQLKQFQQTHNHCSVKPSTDKNLWRWIDSQRTAFRRLQKGQKSSLTRERIELLEEIGFLWDPIDAKFNDRIQELKMFQEKHGHCDVAQSMNLSLYSWMKSQRDQYEKFIKGEKSSLTKERVDLLLEVTGAQNLNLDTVPKKRTKKKKTPWIDNFRLLEEYANEHGNTLVPQKHPKLGMFVKAQRDSYRQMKMGKKTGMTQGRIDLLNSIGFVWNVSDKRRPLKEIALERAIQRTIIRRNDSQKNLRNSSNPELLLEHYQKNSLWGIC